VCVCVCVCVRSTDSCLGRTDADAPGFVKGVGSTESRLVMVGADDPGVVKGVLRTESRLVKAGADYLAGGSVSSSDDDRFCTIPALMSTSTL
jgi:hypothetical protein